MLRDDLTCHSREVESYLMTSCALGVVLLDSDLTILDCNLGFMRVFKHRQKPVGVPLAHCCELAVNDIRYGEELRLPCSPTSGIEGIVYCYLIQSGQRHILFCEKLLLTESRVLEQMSTVNDELINLQRDLIKKNRLLEKMKIDLDERIAERTRELTESMKSLEKSERFKQTIMDSLPASIAVIDQQGVILTINKKWKHFAQTGSLNNNTLLNVGDNYLDCFRNVAVSESEAWNNAQKALHGIQSVLTGRRNSFTIDYASYGSDGKQWFQIIVARPGKSFTGAVVSFIDISALKQLEMDQREYTQHVVDSIEKERIRIARELHDSIGQSLTLLSFDVARTQQELFSNPDILSTQLAGISDCIQKMAINVQSICTNLRPALLDDLGLAAAVEWLGEEFSRRSGISCTVIWDDLIYMSQHCSTDIFRVVQESLNNVGKYSHASNVTITFMKRGKRFVLEISDDGCGFDMDMVRIEHGFGIKGMRERAASLEAEFEIKSSPNKGTSVILSMPSA